MERCQDRRQVRDDNKRGHGHSFCFRCGSSMRRLASIPFLGLDLHRVGDSHQQAAVSLIAEEKMRADIKTVFMARLSLIRLLVLETDREPQVRRNNPRLALGSLLYSNAISPNTLRSSILVLPSVEDQIERSTFPACV